MNKNQDMATVAHLHNNPAKHILWNISRHFESTAYGSSFTFSSGETLSLILFLSSPQCAIGAMSHEMADQSSTLKL